LRGRYFRLLGTTPVIGHAPSITVTEKFASMFATTREKAQGLVEYGLIIALVAVLAIAGLVIFGPAVSSLLSKLGGSV
jgi:Flp pilus assembly pilin Flp